MDFKKLAKEINRNFSTSLPKGFVRAWVTEDNTLWLSIGDRDGEFDQKGNCVGSGSMIAGEWEIKQKGTKV
jgi:hypothetical protein